MGKGRQARFGDPFAKCFAPQGKSSAVLYAVCLNSHEGVVKFGRTGNWRSRRKAYASWNLSPGNAIANARAYVLTDDWVDLPRLENALLAASPFPVRHGNEWFHAEFAEACEFIERFLDHAGISYVTE